jgi:hypothetical protein
MQEARVNGCAVQSGPDSPQEAFCPSCGEEVKKRKRRRDDGSLTYFYRHKTGAGDGCARRCTPISY